MSRTWFSLDGLGLLLGSAVLLLAGCQDQQPEPVAPQFAKSQAASNTDGHRGRDRVRDRHGAGVRRDSGFHCAIGAGTNDPLECSRTYGWKTVVVLTAAAQPGSAFAGWTGACTGTSTQCRVTMTQSRDVRASFSGSGVASFTLNLSGSGTGTGTVQSQTGLSPAINCTITTRHGLRAPGAARPITRARSSR